MLNSLSLVEINKLKKSQASKPEGKKPKEIEHPQKYTNLQAAMGLADDKKLYSHCLVSLFFFTVQLELGSNNYNRQLFKMSQCMQV